MEIVWKIQTVLGRNKTVSWGDFILNNNDIYHVFSEFKGSKNSDEHYISVLKIDSLTGEYTKNSQRYLSSEFEINFDWRLFINNNDIILYTGKFFNISKGDIVALPDNYGECIKDWVFPNFYERYKKGEVFKKNIPDEYIFGNLIVSYNGKTIIECIDKNNNQKLWKNILRRGGGYVSTVELFTEIEYKNGHIIFLTQNLNGYRLCCIELFTGIVKLDNIRTHFGWYVWDDDTILFFDENGNLQQINPFENKIIQKSDFSVKAIRKIELINDIIYILSYRLNKSILICIRK